MKKFLFTLCMVVLAFAVKAQDCMPETVYADSIFNTQVAKIIKTKFSTSNSPVFAGKYLRHVAKTQFEEKKKGGKVVARQMLFLVAKRNEKGECKFINVMIQQDMQADGTWGKPYVDAGTPAAGSPDCACIEKMKDWYRP